MEEAAGGSMPPILRKVVIGHIGSCVTLSISLELMDVFSHRGTVEHGVAAERADVIRRLAGAIEEWGNAVPSGMPMDSAPPKGIANPA